MGLVGTQGRRPTFHDLRHTFATFAIAEGIDVKTVSSIMGHANAAMTLDIYASADADAKRAAAMTIDEAMGRRLAPQELGASLDRTLMLLILILVA
jgi:integrase